MKRMIIIAAVLLGLIGAVSVAFNQDLNDPAFVLKKRLGFSNDDVKDFRNGKAITRRIETPNDAELVIGGAVFLEVPTEFVINNSRDILQTNRTSAVAEIGVFDNPPTMENLKDMSLVDSDVDAIKNCDVGSCDIKLSKVYIDKFKELDENSSGYRDSVKNIFFNMILGYVEGYQKQGIASMLTYYDQDYTLDLRKEYRDILQSSALLRDYDEEILTYLEQFPDHEMKNVEDYFFWIKQNFDNLRPITALIHYCLFLPDSLRPAVLTKTQIYSSHYYEGSLEATIFIPEENNPEHSGCNLIYVKRARYDTLRRGSFLGIKSAKLRSGVEDEVDNLLKKTKRKVESLYKQSLQE